MNCVGEGDKFDGGDGVEEEVVVVGGALQWCLNICESVFSNEGVTEAMNESACLCGSVGSLLTPSAFFFFIPRK